MPEMQFHIRWPDGSDRSCYSPSLVIEEHLSPGHSYPLAEFLDRIDVALTIASHRVEQKFGMPCTRALGQLAEINRLARAFPQQDATVTVLGFTK